MAAEYKVPRKYAHYGALFDQLPKNGDGVVTLDEFVGMAKGMMMPMMGMLDAMGVPMATAMYGKQIEGMPRPVEQQLAAVPSAMDTLKELGPRVIAGTPAILKAQVELRLADALRPIFNLVDVDSSGTISKKEFLGIMMMVDFMQKFAPLAFQARNARGERSRLALTGLVKDNSSQLLDAAYLCLDADGSDAIDQEEVAVFVHKVLHGAAELIGVFVDIGRELITKELTDGLVAVGLEFAGSKGIGDGKSISFEQCAPLIAMGDQLFMMAQARMEDPRVGNPAMAAMTRQILAMEREAFARHAVDGKLNYEHFIDAVNDYMPRMKDVMQANWMSFMPPQMPLGPVAEIQNYGIHPGEIMARAMDMDHMTRIVKASFSLLADKDGFLALEEMDKFVTVFAPKSGEGPPKTPEERVKIIFSLLDRNSDGTFDLAELQNLTVKVVDFWFALIADMLVIYADLLSDVALVKGGLSFVDKQRVDALESGRMPQQARIVAEALSFPIEKGKVAGLLSTFTGQPVGISDAVFNDMTAELFQLYDRNHDGLLNFKEIKLLNAHTEGQGFTEATWKMISGTYNFDVDKGMDLATFRKIMSGDKEQVAKDLKKGKAIFAAMEGF